ncbi:MAG TPA: prolyl oligopeptidase family serine peptidase [Myxococcales bacterium]
MIPALLCLLAALTGADFKFLEDVARTRYFRLGRPNSVKLTDDGTTALFLRSPARSPEMRLYAFDVKSGAVRELITPEQVLKGAQESLSPEERARRERMRVTVRGFTAFEPSRDGRRVLVTLSGRAFVVPIAGGAAREVAGPDAAGHALFDPKLSPDGSKLAFVRAHELWVTDLATGATSQITFGAHGLVTHGEAEFVAQEELDRFSGYVWSADSTRLIYEEADARAVEQLWFGDPARPQEAVEATPYPRPGKPNVRTRFGLVSARGGATTWISIDPRWEYVSRLLWQEGGPPALIVLSRDQQSLALLEVDARTGATRALLSEHDAAWLNADRACEWLRDGSGFLWSSETRGAWQLELRSRSGALMRELTPARPLFRTLVHVGSGRAVFIGGEEQPDRQVFAVGLDGKGLTQITGGPDLHAAVYARDAETSVVTTTPLQDAVEARVVRADGTVAGELPSVAERPPFDVKLSAGKAAGMWTAVVRPHDFDPRRKYPVIASVYGGPHATVVHPEADAHTIDQWIADHGYLVVYADGRGTPGRGREWERAIKDAFAFVPLEDQVSALRALAEAEPAMDLQRVGVMGHSFGGFMAALSVMRRPDVYRAAVAGAPVVDWLDYDTAYTERYLGVPAPAGRSSAYERNGLLRWAKDLGAPLLVFHGTADDNVHFTESLRLADALFAAGRPFQLVPLSGQTHLFYDPQLLFRYWERIFDFFDANLARR